MIRIANRLSNQSETRKRTLETKWPERDEDEKSQNESINAEHHGAKQR